MAIDRIVVYKSRHILEAWSGSTCKTWEVALGVEEGAKTREGDYRTPEGFYFIAAKRSDGVYRYFLTISYPNARDRAAFEEAKRTGVLPKDARIGGQVGIHGTGWKRTELRGILEGRPILLHWTSGCLAVSDEVIAELYAEAPIGTSVLINP